MINPRSAWRRFFLNKLATPLAILAGAAFFLWPAIVNGYPIVFSDTHAFLVQAAEPFMIWDKPWIYGPFLIAVSMRVTLWLPAMAQCLLLSHLLWLTAKACDAASPLRHLALCAFLAVGTTAPWFASLLMPDLMAPVAVLCLYLLGFGDRLRRWEQGWAGGVGTFAIASHLSLVVVSAVCIGIGVAWRRRFAIVAPLAAAVWLLLLTNVVGFGEFAISPYGSVFALARLVADGPAREVLAEECPAAGWRLCEWSGRLPDDSDAFLWDPDGPVWTTPGGPIAFAPEASAIVGRTLLHEPGAVAHDAISNSLRQLVMVRLRDTLEPAWLGETVAIGLGTYFPPAELRRFEASLQARDRLAAVAAPFRVLQETLLILGAIATPVLLFVALRRRDTPRAGLAVLVLAALLANAFATGALSGPHDRYQARIAWLLLLPPALQIGARASTSAGGSRTSCS
jgi:hypothetical protein